MAGEFVVCTRCILFEDCEDKERQDGCYFGEEDEADETVD